MKSRQTKQSKIWTREWQEVYVARLRAESVLDRSLPLGSTAPPRPEKGPSAVEYYRKKGYTGQYGDLNPVLEEL
jgi:hypothetical protein